MTPPRSVEDRAGLLGSDTNFAAALSAARLGGAKDSANLGSDPKNPCPAKPYVGRFAPSPTGALHAGSLVAALASWLDAHAWELSHPGASSRWLVRIEDVDQPRSIAGADRIMLQQLADCGLVSDEPPVWQSRRTDLYQAALERLLASGAAYPCACSRKDVEVALAASGTPRPRHGELIYPRTCRHGLNGKPARAWRFATDPGLLTWTDRRLGPQQQNVSAEVGDFVLKRADGCFAYQLAVVVDDAAQGVTHVVRGEDLADNTPRQILLQRALQLPTPQYLHTPLVLGADGDKLSKQNGAQPLDTRAPLAALNAAAAVLGLRPMAGTVGEALHVWVKAWAERYPTTTDVDVGDLCRVTPLGR